MPIESAIHSKPYYDWETRLDGEIFDFVQKKLLELFP